MKSSKKSSLNAQILIYQSDDGNISVDTLLKDETIWLSQKSMAELFNCTPENALIHLKNIYEAGELNEKATTKDFLVVQKEGNREVSRKIKHYNLDAIISVGYRVNSLRGTQFRMWATQRLKELESDLKKLTKIIHEIYRRKTRTSNYPPKLPRFDSRPQATYYPFPLLL